MKNRVFTILCAIILLACPASRVAAQSTGGPAATTPSTAGSKAIDFSNLGALLTECFCKGTGKLITEYTYLFETTRYRKHDRGAPEIQTELYEVYAPPVKPGQLTYQIPILVSKNGKAISPKQLEKERLRAGEKLEKEEREAKNAGNESPSFKAGCAGITPIGTYFTLTIPGEATERKFKFTPLSVLLFNIFEAPRYEELNGRRMVALDFRPRGGVSFEADERYMEKLGGIIWIDAEDKIAARIEVWPLSGNESMRSISKGYAAAGKGPAVFYEQTRLPDGVWLPKKIQLNTNTYGFVFGRYYYDVINVFSEHKRFTTSVEEVTTARPVKQP